MTVKPDGCNSVSPYLIVNGTQATIDFLVAVFNARRLRTIPRDGKLRHAGVRLADTVLMLAEAIDGWPAFLPASTSMSLTRTPPILARWRPARRRYENRSSRTMRTSAAVSGMRVAPRGG
jgi:hypothetical protein